MRDVLFRGKARLSVEELDALEIIHEDGWVFGNYIENGFSPYIVGDLADVGNDYIAHEWWVEVVPESVGQWTGVNEIFEGDRFHLGDPNITYTVIWHDTGLKGKQDGSSSFAGIDHWKDRIEVIGSVFEGATNER